VSAFLRLDLPLLLLLLLNRGLPWKLADCWRRAYLQWVGHQKVLLGALPELFSRIITGLVVVPAHNNRSWAWST
jgi:hypothetical protein